MKTGEIIIYQAPDGTTNLDVRLEEDTVWLTQEQIAQLFGTKRPAITKHLNNIYKVGELEEYSTCSILEHMGNDAIQRYKTKYYNLDAILSVGYRVNSKNATKFRIWASTVLKDYIVKGYAINQRVKLNQLNDLKQTVKLLSNVIQSKELTVEETTGDEKFHATYENAMEAIIQLKGKFGGSDLFANEKDQSFKSSIRTIYQTFGGADLYPSVEEKAAMLLYLVTKNHSFSDGKGRCELD